MNLYYHFEGVSYPVDIWGDPLFEGYVKLNRNERIQLNKNDFWVIKGHYQYGTPKPSSRVSSIPYDCKTLHDFECKTGVTNHRIYRKGKRSLPGNALYATPLPLP